MSLFSDFGKYIKYKGFLVDLEFFRLRKTLNKKEERVVLHKERGKECTKRESEESSVYV